MKKLTVILGLVLVMLLVPLSCAPPAPESGVLAIQPEIIDITITGYHSTRDIEGNYDPDRVEATFNWETNKPCYYCFELRPVDFDYPSNSGGYEKLDVIAPLPEGVKHSLPIVLKSGKAHLYVLTIWDKEKNYFTKSDTFWAPVVPKAPPPPAPAPMPAPAPAPAPAPVPPSVTQPEPVPTARIGDTIPNCSGKQGLSMTLLWWKESDIVVNGEYVSGYYTFTAIPSRKFIILAYEFRNDGKLEQETPYLTVGEIVTAPKGYCYKAWKPPSGIHSEEYNPHKATSEEIR